MRKGIILAGGSGTRLYPLTRSVSKQLLPVYDKPMIYYPLTTLMLAGISDILIVTTPADLSLFERLLGDGGQWGLRLQYAAQNHPEGVAQALIIGEEFLAGNPCGLVLGDNIFYGHNLRRMLRQANRAYDGATIFAYHVQDPERYGVVTFAENGSVLSIEEKPLRPVSPYAVTGLYFYDALAPAIAKKLPRSDRGLLEITAINQRYLEMGQLTVITMPRGYAWLDAGTHDSLLEACQFIASLESRQGLKIGCVEEIAWRTGRITLKDLEALAKPLVTSTYGQYLLRLVKEESRK